MVVITPEHYNRIVRLIEHKIPVKVAFDIQAQFLGYAEDSVNVIAEIPGGKKKDEIVMIGAHLDSWHGGTGATDNAAGSRRDDGSDAHSEVAGPEAWIARSGWRCGAGKRKDCSDRRPT